MSQSAGSLRITTQVGELFAARPSREPIPGDRVLPQMACSERDLQATFSISSMCIFDEQFSGQIQESTPGGDINYSGFGGKTV